MYRQILRGSAFFYLINKGNKMFDLQKIGDVLTMSSLELLEIVNNARKELGGTKTFRPERGGTPMK